MPVQQQRGEYRIRRRYLSSIGAGPSNSLVDSRWGFDELYVSTMTCTSARIVVARAQVGWTISPCRQTITFVFVVIA